MGRTGVIMVGTIGVSGGGCDGSWSFGNCSAVFFYFFFLEVLEAPKVLLREEPVFLAPFLAFPAMVLGETGVEATSTKMGSPSSSNKVPVLIVHSG